MDLQTEQEVWRRVKAPGNVTARETLLPERLEGLILEQRGEAAELRALARRLRGQGAAALNRTAAGIEARTRELSTLHYLLTGRKLRLPSPPPRLKGPETELLRELILRLRQSAQAYESLETEFSDYAGDFSRCASDTRSQARRLTQLLQTRLQTRL